MTDPAAPPLTYDFRFTRAFALAALPFGITPGRTDVRIEDGRLTARYGPWQLTTTLDNIVRCTVTGPYAVPKVIGPPHLTFSDRGLTFASNPDLGAFVEFARPVPGISGVGWPRHPNLTLTVSDPHALAAALMTR